MSENRIYNEDQKERYLNFVSDNEGTKTTIRSIFYKSWVYEDGRNRDLCNFNLEELGKVIEGTNPFSKSVARTTTRFLSSYISWAIQNGLRDNNINPLDGVSVEWVESHVDDTKKIHYSYDEFIELLEKMKNGQDQAFLFMLFEGLGGERFRELINLKFENIDWNTNEIYVEERAEKIKVSNDCMKYIKKAYEEDEYHQYNTKTNQYTIKKLLASSYIFKNIESPRGTEDLPLKINVIYKRLQSIKEIFRLDFLTPNAIKQSGMVKMAVDIYKRDGILAYNQLAEVGKKYDYSMLTNNGSTYYNTYLMKEFLNENSIKELYDIDLEIKLR